jgi:hypothetical protein
MSEEYDLALEEWLGVLADLWTAAGKPLEADRLQVYRRSLEDVPLGLLELAVQRVIRENVYHVVPLPGVVWVAVRRELGEPWDVRMALEDWARKC